MSDELDPQPEVPAPTAKSTTSMWVIAGAASLALAAGAVVGVKVLAKDDTTSTLDAQPSSQSATGTPTMVRFGNAGKITKIDGDSFTLQSQNFTGETETVKVQTDDDTTFTDVVEGSLSSLKVGQQVVANGTTTDGVMTAERITPSEVNRRRAASGGDTPPMNADGQARMFNGPPPNGAMPDGAKFDIAEGSFVGGEITRIEGDTVTVKDMSGETKTIKVTDATKVMVNKTIKLQDLDVGDNVRVGGETKDNVLRAESVTRGDDMAGPPGMLRGGPMTQQSGTESSAS